MADHLGYEKGDPAGWGSGNNRNGSYPKTVQTDAGTVGVEMPRDRNATFEPQLIPKHQRRLRGFNELVISLVARGMTTRDTRAHLQEIYGVEVGAGPQPRRHPRTTHPPRRRRRQGGHGMRGHRPGRPVLLAERDPADRSSRTAASRRPNQPPTRPRIPVLGPLHRPRRRPRHPGPPDAGPRPRRGPHRPAQRLRPSCGSRSPTSPPTRRG